MRRMKIQMKKINNRLKTCCLDSGFCLLKFWGCMFLGWLIPRPSVPWLAPGCACFISMILFCSMSDTYFTHPVPGFGSLSGAKPSSLLHE
jgi:hypothetical protein